MCFYLSGFACLGCARKFATTFQCCPTSYQPLHHTPSLGLLDLIRINGYNCPYPGCELNGNVHHALFNLHVDAVLENNSFFQAGFPFLPLDAYSQSAADVDDEPCELALSESEKRDAFPLPKKIQPRSSAKSVRFSAAGLSLPQNFLALRALRTSRGQPGRAAKIYRASARSLMTSGRIMKCSSKSTHAQSRRL